MTASGHSDKGEGKIHLLCEGQTGGASQLRAPCRPFVFGVFHCQEDAYNLYGAEVENYFDELASDMECACYASYFAEFAGYYGRENVDESETIRLLYQSFRALLKPAIPNRLVRRIFELRLMAIQGEYREAPDRKISDSALYAWQFVISTPIEKLYTFLLTEPVFEEFARCVEDNKRRYVDREFRSLEILRVVT